MANGMINILIADDHSIIRQGIRGLINDVPDIEIIGEASDGIEAKNMIMELKPDVALMDISMPKLFGYEVVRQLADQGLSTKFLMITIYDVDIYFYKSIRAGAHGMINKNPTKEELVEAIRTIYSTDFYYFNKKPAEEIEQILKKFDNVDNENFDPEAVTLTFREKEIMRGIIDGKSYQEIADELFISYKTVERHKKNITVKYCAKNTFDLIVLFMTNEKLKRSLYESN